MPFFLIILKTVNYIVAFFSFAYDNLVWYFSTKISNNKYESKKRILIIFERSVILWAIKKSVTAIKRRASKNMFVFASKSPLGDMIFKHYLKKLDFDGLYPEEYTLLSYYAIENKDIKLLEMCTANLLHESPLAIEQTRDLAVQLFLQGNYSEAKKVWTVIENFRKSKIKYGNLDSLGIRILPIHWFIAVGHIAHLDSYFKSERMNGVINRKYIFDIPPNFKIPNPYFLRLWAHSIDNISRSEISPFITNEERILLQDDFWAALYKSDEALMFNEYGAVVQEKWSNFSSQPLVSIPDEDILNGNQILRKMGISEGVWYVCLHVREPGFHQGWHDQNPGTRNADIETYYDAIDLITSKGGFVIRLGDKSMRPLKATPGVIDYPFTEFKSDFMDIFLCATCRFFIGTNSGLGLIPPIFNKLCVLTNWSPVAIPQWYAGDLVVPKLIKESKTGRYLSFKELFETQVGWSQFEKFFIKLKLTVVDNTSEEIKNAVIDMFTILDGRIENDSTHLVNQYSNIVLKNIGYIGSRVAPSFVKKYRDLLSDQDKGSDVHDQ